jgi:hypothetical protein
MRRPAHTNIEAVNGSQRISVRARLVENEITQHRRQSGALRSSNKLRRRNLTYMFMPPGGGSLDGNSRPACKAHDRLVLHFEPAVGRIAGQHSGRQILEWGNGTLGRLALHCFPLFFRTAWQR